MSRLRPPQAIGLVAFLVLGLACERASVASTPVVPIGEPETDLDEPFTRITSLAELHGGDVILIDAVTSQRSEVLYVDFPTGVRRPIGRQGQGPHEYSDPVRLLAGRGDTTLLVERWSRRFVVIDSDGSIRGRVPVLSRDPDMVDDLGGVAPIARDSFGRLYHVPGELRRSLAHRRDSLPLVRYSHSTPGGDTLTWLGRTPPGLSWSPYLSADGWGVFPDGRVAILRSPAYRIDWIEPDARTPVPGLAIPYEAVAITQADIDAVQIRVPVGASLPPYLAQLQAQLRRPLDEWPRTKAPTRTGAGGTGIFTRPQGEMWIARWPAASDSMQSWDVIDPPGVLARRVVLPKAHRLLAVTTSYAYVIRRDSVDLEYLGRYRIPDR